MPDTFIQTPFFKIAAQEYHNNEQNKLLAVHGWMDNAASFSRLLPHLPSFHSVAMDLPGHGWSQHRSEDGNYSFMNWPIDVVHVIEALSWEKLTLVGHSLGASIACFVAAVCPKKIERLVLIEGLGPLTKGSDDPVTSLQNHIKDNDKYRGKKPPVYKDVDILIEKRRSVGNLRRQDAQILIERSVRKTAEGYQWCIDNRLRTSSPVRLTEEQVLSVLGKIECPVLLFKAQSGIPYNEDQVKKRCAAMKQLEIHEIPGSHHMHMEYPEQIAAFVK